MNKNTLNLVAEINREISKAMNATIDAAAISAGFCQDEELVNERQEEGKMAKEMLKAYGLEVEDFNDICLDSIAEINREISKKMNATIDAAAVSAGFGQDEEIADGYNRIFNEFDKYYFHDYVDESWFQAGRDQIIKEILDIYNVDIKDLGKVELDLLSELNQALQKGNYQYGDFLSLEAKKAYFKFDKSLEKLTHRRRPFVPHKINGRKNMIRHALRKIQK